MKAKQSKKIIIESLLAAVIFMILLAAVVVSVLVKNVEKKDVLKVFIASDIHVAASETFESDEQYAYYCKSERLKDASEAIFRSFADELIEQKAKFLLISGDLTDNGEESSALAVANTLKKLEQNGVNVFVINGNHDIDYSGNGAAINANEFKDIFYEFGYEKALSIYDGTLSYMTSLNDKYNLIAIDNIEYFRPNGTLKKGFDTEHRFWVCEMIDECLEQGKIPIVMAHRPFMNHYPGKLELHDYKSIKDEGNAALTFFAKRGVEYVFVGHEHFNDIKEMSCIFETADNIRTNTVCEVMSSCLCMSKSYYREVLFGKDETKFTLKELTKINTNYLSEFATARQKKEMSDNYSQYVSDRLYSWLKDLIDSALEPGGLLDISFPNEELTELYDIAKNKIVKKLLDSPLYIKDEKSGDISLQRVLRWYNKAMPETEFVTVYDFAFDVLSRVVAGEKKIAYDGFYDIIKYIVYEAVWYINETSPQINSWISEQGGTKAINIDMDRLFERGELECYESGLMPAFVETAGNIIINIVPEDKAGLAFGVLNSLSKDFGILKNELIATIIGGMFFPGYEEYIYDDYIDVEGLLTEGVFGVLLEDFTEERKYNGKEIIITKEELRNEESKGTEEGLLKTFS